MTRERPVTLYTILRNASFLKLLFLASRSEITIPNFYLLHLIDISIPSDKFSQIDVSSFTIQIRNYQLRGPEVIFSTGQMLCYLVVIRIAIKRMC